MTLSHNRAQEISDVSTCYHDVTADHMTPTAPALI